MKIKHIAIKVDDMDVASEFYINTLGLQHVSTIGEKGGERGRVSMHLTDGYLDITLIEYDSEQAEGALLAGPGPCIHHIGMEVDDMDCVTEKIVAAGAEVMSKPGKIPVKFRTPAGPLAEIVPTARFEKDSLQARGNKVA